MTAPRISLTIDRLVLRGVDRADAAAVRRALGAALETMLAGADPKSPAPAPRLRLDIAPAAGPTALGHAAGRALGGAIARGGGEG
jgi:hypothetical protein